MPRKSRASRSPCSMPVVRLPCAGACRQVCACIRATTSTIPISFLATNRGIAMRSWESSTRSLPPLLLRCKPWMPETSSAIRRSWRQPWRSRVTSSRLRPPARPCAGGRTYASGAPIIKEGSMQPFSDLTRLSLNQMTTKPWSVREAVEGCVRAGIPSIGLWREPVAETGLRESARIVADAGLRVSSLCRGGWFSASTHAERQARLDDNRRAIDEAAELHTDVLVLVCGPATDRDITSARAYVEEAIASLLPYAAERGIQLGIEPLHPMYAAERSVIVTLAEA